MPNWKFTISYDGTNYHGWQVQPDEPTVQGTIQDKLSLLFDRNVKIVGASRTDAGVHAKGQVASVELPDKFTPEELRYRLDKMLPADIAIKKIEPAADDFSARFSAVEKLYEFRIIDHKEPRERNFASTIERELDMDILNSLSSIIIGKHDFSAFTIKRDTPDNPICEISAARWDKTRELTRFTIRGNRFLHKMVRALVGAMLDCERGRFSKNNFASMIERGQRLFDYRIAGPQGLWLIEVYYGAKPLKGLRGKVLESTHQ
ncbi:tRNA pseudouridine(38-40) synthase TruA [bacterium]|nr:tRNA pseudouridine(38-40) synthase TruA [bacterium]